MAILAMELAIEKAKKSGVGIVSVRNSNHYGIAGYYAKMACDEGLIGFFLYKTLRQLWYLHLEKKAMLGSNPIACSYCPRIRIRFSLIVLQQ